MSEDLLFELGTEEIPPAFLPKVAENLRKDLRKGLQDERLDFEEIELFFTPRRIAVRVNDLQERQEDKIEKHRGPSEGIGLDEDGNYTIAAKKFAQGHAATEEDLYLEENGDGTYFFVEEKIEGRKAGELLPDLLSTLTKNLEQPEKMRWDDSSVRFIRPIRWITCLLGSKKVDFAIGNVNSSSDTRGHRFHGDDIVHLENPAQYEERLESNSVIPSSEKRLEKMENQISQVTADMEASVASKDEFLELLSNTLEYPTIVSGSFPDRFLDLPKELLFKTLTGEARLIPLVNSESAPISTFIGFRDGPRDETGRVRQGYESVINSRLRDSKFFFNHDRERPLEEYLDELKTVTFQEKLGSIHDKVERIRKIAEQFASTLGGIDTEVADRTVKLSKADLVTEVVDEFPSLEGIIGAYYAELDGEPEEVVQGIRQHYRPRNTQDDPPEYLTAIVTGVSDKLDTLLGSFIIGEKPTGTRDPYGLRRKTDGIIRTLIDREINFDISDLIEYAGTLYDMEGTGEAVESLKNYFQERLERVLERVYDIPYDVVNAISTGEGFNFYDSYLRAKTLEEFKDEPAMKDLVDLFTRIVNITEGREKGEINPEIFQLSQEKDLWNTFTEKMDVLEELARKQSYRAMTRKLLNLKDPIDEYFENVMVMADDEEQQENRINFLLYLKEPFLQLGDLSKIVKNHAAEDGS
ncbi:glycine--tRNA ligase subunit beta [Candidatus Bipolaricaulota bacterium]|nr:glycine--tRNA ligase subunit beta [Candidatus Bipolaricaulota bacterium]